jgi:hypothetical protein
MEDYLNMSTMPDLTQLLQYGNFNPNSVEGVRQSQYDFQLYQTAGAGAFNFFQVPQGQGVSTQAGNAANTKGAGDTSMTQAGMLPSPQAQLVTSLEIIFEAGSVATAGTFTPQVAYSFVAVPTALVPLSAGAVNDVSLLRQTGSLAFFIGTRNMLVEAPLGRFPPKTAMAVDSSIASNSATTASLAIASAKWGGRPYYLDPPLLLLPSVNFNVLITFPIVVATPSGFNGRVGVIGDGYLYRNS